MTRASFIDDDWVCECGNQPHTTGFFPCRRDGTLIDPETDDSSAGILYRCMSCDRTIQGDVGDGFGRIVGQAAPQSGSDG